MTQRTERYHVRREFIAAQLPPSVVEALETLVRSRHEVREAHLVSSRGAGTARAAPTLVIVTENPTVATTLGDDLRRLLQPHTRPRILVLAEAGEELVRIRGLGGELKRGEERFPWWLLFLGM